MKATRESLMKDISRAGLEWGDEEDAAGLVDVLLEGFTPLQAQTWLFLHDSELGGTPLIILEEGRYRDVVRRARFLVAQVSK